MKITIKIDNIREIMLHTMIKTLTSPKISFKTLFSWNDDNFIDNRLLDSTFINQLEETEDEEGDMMIDITDDFDKVLKKLFFMLGLPKKNEIKLTNKINSHIFNSFIFVLTGVFSEIEKTTLQICSPKSHGNVAFHDRLEDIRIYKTTFFNVIEMEDEPLLFDKDHIVIKINDESQDRNKAQYLCLKKTDVTTQLKNLATIKYPCFNSERFMNPDKDYDSMTPFFSLSSVSGIDILISKYSLGRFLIGYDTSRYYAVAVKIFVDIPSFISKSAEMGEIISGYHCQSGIGKNCIYMLLPVEYTQQTISYHSAASSLNLRQRSKKTSNAAPKKTSKKSTKKK